MALDEYQNPADPPGQMLAEQWSECVRRAYETTCQELGPFENCAEPRSWRRLWFERLGQYTDTFLRSPPFLQTIRTHVNALTEWSRTASSAWAPDEKEEYRPGRGADATAAPAHLEILHREMAALDREAALAGVSDEYLGYLISLREQQTAPPAQAGATPHDVVYARGALKLLRYRSDQPRYSEPILICYALVNRPYVLDLQAERSVIRALCAAGFNVYLIDWGTPTPADRTLRLDDYVGNFMKQIVEFTCQHARCERLNLLGYCMGGTMSTMFTALYPERIQNLILLATPVDFAGDEGLLNLWARAEYFDVDKLIDTYGNCPGEFLRYSFQLMKPVQNFAEKYLAFYERLGDGTFLDDFLALERWASDSIPVAGETFREYVKLLYQQNRLVKGQMQLSGLTVKLEAITRPLLLLTAERDHLVPPSSTLALKRYVRSSDVKCMSIRTGHIGLAVSSKAHRELWPAAASWIAEFSSQLT